jgi:hypothetical protein
MKSARLMVVVISKERLQGVGKFTPLADRMNAFEEVKKLKERGATSILSREWALRGQAGCGV